MPESSRDITQTLVNIRKTFDESFAVPPLEARQELIEFAIITAGGTRYALRMRELAGVAVDRRIIPVPTGTPGVLGLSAVEGQLVPVFELAALLGASTTGGPLRWLALYQAAELLALAFEHFQGSVRVAPQAVHATSARGRFCNQAVQVDSGFIHVLELAALAQVVSNSNANEGKK